MLFMIFAFYPAFPASATLVFWSTVITQDPPFLTQTVVYQVCQWNGLPFSFPVAAQEPFSMTTSPMTWKAKGVALTVWNVTVLSTPAAMYARLLSRRPVSV